MKKLSQKCFSLFMVFAIMLSNFFPLFSIGRVFADADRRVQIINDVEYNGSGTFTISGGGYDGTESFSSSRSSFFEENTELTLTATPSNRYIFIGWFNCEEFEQVPGQHAWRTVGDALTTDAEYTFTVTESFYNLMPVFATGHNNIWVSGNGSIAVDYDNSEVDWQDGEDYRNGDMIDFVIGDSVTVKAQPSDGSHFVGWYVSNAEQGPDYYYSDSLVSTDEVYTYQPLVTMVAGIEDPINYLTAVFAEDSSSTRQVLQFQVWHTDGGATAIQYTIDEPNPLNLSSREELDFEPAVGAIYYGIEATVTAQPHEDYRFAGWKHVDIDYDPESVDHSEICVGEFITTTTSYTYQPGVTVLPGDEEELRYICAVFESIPTQDVHFELNGGTWEGANPITVNEGSIISRPAMNPTKDFNVFVDWFEDAELSIPFDFEHTAINTETTIYAKWSEHAYIAVGVSQSGGTWSSVELNATDMTGPMNATYNANAEVTLTANSIDGFHFVGWYEGIIGESSYVEDHTGLLYSSNPTYTTSLMNYDFSIMAVFEENNSNPPQSFTVTFKDGNDVLDSRNIVAGDYVERPNPDPFKDGFVFENWYEDFECSIPFNFNNPINGNTEIFAHFNENNNQVITFQLDAATVSGDVITFYVGDGEVTATVTGTGYSFSGNNLIVNVSDLNNVKLVLDANFTSNNMSLELHDGQVLTVTGDNEAIFDGLDFTNDNSPHLQLVDYAGGGHGQVGGPDDISFDIDLHGTYTIIEINGKEVIGDTDIFQEDYVINDLLVEEAGVADPAEFNVIKVTPRFGDNAIAACTINGVEYTLESEAVEYYDYGWFITVPGAANYVISATGDPNIATPKTIIWVNPDYVPENEEEAEWVSDFTITHGTARVVEVYDGDGQLVDPETYVGMDADEYGIHDGFGWVAIMPGSRVVFEFVPDYGYQLTGIAINETPLDAIDSTANRFEVEIPNEGGGNLHFAATFTATDDVVKSGSEKVTGGEVSLGSDLEGGSVQLTVHDVELSSDKIKGFENAAGDYTVSHYLDIDLYNVFYKGKEDDEDVWSNKIDELDAEATISLKLADGITADDIVLVHNIHDGEEYEIIQIDSYDPVTNVITFKAKSFSNYAIATKTATANTTENATSNPQTSDATYMWLSLFAVSLFILVFCAIKMKKSSTK